MTSGLVNDVAILDFHVTDFTTAAVA